MPKLTPATCLLLATITCCHAEPLPDGLYPIVADADAPTMPRGDSHESVALGRRIEVKLERARLGSTSNDNSEYRLDVSTDDFPEAANVGQKALVIAGLCIPVATHRESENDPAATFVGNVIGEENAARLAAALQIEPRLRTHPGHQLAVSVRPEKPTYHPREPVTLTLRIKNVGETTIHFMDGGSQRGPRNNQFGFTAFRNHGHGPALPDTGDPRHHGGIATFQTLAPGDSFEKSVDLSKWFTFDAADTYRVTAIYRMTLHDGDLSRPLWDDFAVATCDVRVVKEQQRE